MSDWELFDAKKAIPGLSPGVIILTLTVRQATFTVEKWSAIRKCTHVLYYTNEPENKIGIRFVSGDELAPDEESLAYAISDQGHHRISFNCRRFIDSLPFRLVNGPSGKWQLKFDFDDNKRMAIIGVDTDQ